MNEQEFIIETKLDGERFMLHKQDNMFKYFSRGLVHFENLKIWFRHYFLSFKCFVYTN